MVVQAILICLYFFVSYDLSISTTVFNPDYLGWILLIYGSGLLAITLIQLKFKVPFFPSPSPSSLLITEGVYKFVRHPIFSSLAALFIGYAIISMSMEKLLFGFIIAIFFDFKASYEEQLLQDRFSAYIDYAAKVDKMIPINFFYHKRKK